MAELAPYWDGRFSREGLIWGQEPSPTVAMAAQRFHAENVRTVLVPGSGYGRNTRALALAGFQVTGIELSEKAIALAKHFDPYTRFVHGSALDPAPCPGPYDAIYCFNVLHLFRAPERQVMIEQSRRRLKPGGVAFFTAFAENDPGYGRGPEVEPHTFESRPGRPAHYFDQADLRLHFGAWEVLADGLVEEYEDHGEGVHAHRFRWIYVRNPSGR
ncbi:MAG: class I SAM-dependent methyltransferase [Chloroflexi bacterium]|nr:class I SAM-dependent methyltransferase [Chloroflexota bacterium]